MKKLTFSLLVPLAVTLGWSGASAPIFAETVAPTQVVQKQGTIEHMKTVRVSVNPTDISVREDWFDPAKGLERKDGYYFIDEEKRIEQTRFYDESSSLFERTVNIYKKQTVWKSIGIVEVNGKQVEVLKAYTNAQGNPHYHIAHIDQSTGLPIKVEDYSSTDDLMTVYLYFFDYVHDETGELFKEKQ